ncbi:MAG: hypothetical protein ACWA5P_04650 [bacterium]
MHLLKSIFRFYINSSIHVALAVTSLYVITALEFDFLVDNNFAFFIFLATITGYNFVKYFGLAKFHHRSLEPWLKAIQIFSLLAFLGLVYITFHMPINTIYYFAGAGLVTFLYAIPLLPRKWFLHSNSNLREISGLKIYVIALIWSLVVVVIPIFHHDLDWHFDLTLKAVQIFIYVIAVMLPFEIRDLNYDSLRLGTIPQRIGIANTKRMGVALSLLFLVLELMKDSITTKQLSLTALVAFVMLLLVMKSSKENSIYYSAFLVEALPIMWLSLYLIFGK